MGCGVDIEKQNSIENINFRLAECEKQSLVDIASRKGVSVSRVVRAFVRRGIEECSNAKHAKR